MNHGGGGMDHGGGGMDHGGGGMGHSMPMKCSMNMLWNSQVSGTCVVFESWQIQTWWGMVVSCLAITLISYLYSHLLSSIRHSDRRIALQLQSQSPSQSSFASGLGERTSLNGSGAERERGDVTPGGGRGGAVVRLPMRIRVQRALLYATTVALSFWLMLVAMTYNTYLFFSIIFGAFLGHMTYEADMDVGAVLAGGMNKGLACH